MKGNRWKGVVLVVGLAIFTAWTLFPFLWIISTSIKPDRDLYRKVSLWPETITNAHYIEEQVADHAGHRQYQGGDRRNPTPTGGQEDHHRIEKDENRGRSQISLHDQ